MNNALKERLSAELKRDFKLKAQMVTTLLSGAKWYEPRNWCHETESDEAGKDQMVREALQIAELVLDHVEDSYIGEPDEPEDEEVSE